MAGLFDRSEQCTAPHRHLLRWNHRIATFDAIVDRVARGLAAVVNTLSPGDRVLGIVEEARVTGTVLVGGKRLTGPGLDHGFYVAPTVANPLVIQDVDPDGAAAAAGLQPGDVIVQVNGQAVKSTSELKSALGLASDRPALLREALKGGAAFVTLSRTK